MLYHLAHAVALLALALHGTTNRGAFYLLLAGVVDFQRQSLPARDHECSLARRDHANRRTLFPGRLGLADHLAAALTSSPHRRQIVWRGRACPFPRARCYSSSAPMFQVFLETQRPAATVIAFLATYFLTLAVGRILKRRAGVQLRHPLPVLLSRARFLCRHHGLWAAGALAGSCRRSPRPAEHWGRGGLGQPLSLGLLL